ncbi:MAG: CoB--CoM heterodisulfide reductase iron-sulfur subunit A family protein [Deltaproteobacteria bacterium]|nr:CoB--CoM heterodisulfide reductase iron-sulfur subunit A family protein [Deltaproteobacteria bacterium]
MTGSILVVGGGIAGLTAALEAAEAGHEVHLVEKNHYLGGRVAQLHRYFPKLCPPSCGLEINFKRIRQNPRIHCWTGAQVEKVDGPPGDLEVTVRVAPRYVNERCTACGDCVAVCPVERADDFNYGLSRTTAIYLPHAFAFPLRFAVDRGVCPGLECGRCLPACKVDAIELGMQPRSMKLKVGAVVYATGWQPYDAARLEGLGFGQAKNVITNVMMERLAAPGGPTAGKITRPSDGRPPQHVVFVQCAGSRDENHLAYCSAVCCLASLKQATYVREQVPDARVHMFYIDVRTPGRYEDFYTKVAADPNVTLSRGKVARVSELPGSGNLLVEAENTLTGELLRVETELVVLATGMQPTASAVAHDSLGFLRVDRAAGFGAAGCARRPADVAGSVQDATGAALRAIQTAGRPIHG